MEVDETARGNAAIGRKIDEAARVLNALRMRAALRKLYAQVDVTDIDLDDDEVPARIVRVRLEKA